MQQVCCVGLGTALSTNERFIDSRVDHQEESGVIVGAHCLDCKVGLGESCSHVACVLYYLESWTKVNGKF